MDETRDLCRICLKYEKDDKLFPILSSNNDVALIIYRISGVQVIGSSAQPALICQECVNALHAADELRLKCLQADKYFRQAALKECPDHKSPNYDIVFQNVKVELKEESYELNASDFQLNDYPIDDVPEELKQERLRETLASNSELQFECDICGERAESRLSLKRHIWLLHPTSGKKSACRTCGEEFRSQELLMNHERSHFPHLFYCHYCNKGFDRKTSRENHVKAIHEQSTRSPCDIHGCCFVGSTQAVTIRHKNTVHSLIPKNFSCTECPWKFAYKDALARHMRVHTGEKPFKCSNKGCSRAFSDRRGIRNHQASCSCRDPNAKVEFESCDADEYLDKALEKMKREATRPRKPKDKKCFLCSHCSKTFTKEVSMQEHEIIRHSNAEARFECDICGVRTKTSNSIKRHILMVHPASYRRRVCTTCGKEFKSRSLLTAHEVVHQVGTHVCHSCDKTFKRRDALTKHIKIVHDKSTRIPCTFENCSFIASCYTVLVRHKNTVHKMKPKTIPCTECSKTFAYQDGLKSHMRVHTGEKRYKCSNDGCEREFCDKKGLVRHNLNCPYKNTSVYC